MRHALSIAALLVVVAPLDAQEDIEGLEEAAMRAAVAAVAPSVVKVDTIGGLEKVGDMLVNSGPTTGLVVSADGYIVSSAFNFIQQPSSILVTLPGGQRAAAKIVARDHARMLVLLKVNSPETLPVPTAVPRSEVAVGQWSIAVGRTYDQPEPNLSVGVISATNRVWGKAVQTDAKISPANYGGPLIDIHGRVLGVLVPLSPQGKGSEVAGAEWYNSGIGFAVPLAELNERLETLKAGKDLHPGLLGVSLKPGDKYSLAAEVGASQPGSPAYKAGVKPGDTIVEIDGQKIVRQSQLMHALGARYAGDKVALVLKRGDANVNATVELIDKLDPYAHPFLGILPLRGSADAGTVVRYVYPGSPAAEAGVKVGDKVMSLGDVPVADANGLRTAVANLEPKRKTSLKLDRGGETVVVELLPARLPTAVPGELPPAMAMLPAPPAEAPTTGIVEVKLPEETNECFALVPANYHPQVPHGLLVVLSAPGPIDRAAFEARWKAVAEKHALVVLAPQSAKADKWEPTEADFIRKTLDDAMGHYNIDGTRIATYGYQAGGSMALLVGLGNIDRVRAIAAIDAAPPARTKAPENDPVNRLAFLLGAADKSPTAAQVKAIVAKLEAAQFPITQLPLGEQPRELTADEILEIGRWIDSLDRI